MKISVIIPVYNVGKYLHHCVESVLNQSYKDIEVILIDDGSTDYSGILCDEYAVKDNRIRVIHKANSGVSAARNDGIRIATGYYISFVDSDDYIEHDMLQTLLHLCLNTKSDIGICDVKTRYLNGKVEIESFNLQPEVPIVDIVSRHDDFNKICGPVWQCLYKRELICEKNVFFEEGVPLGEDRLFNMKVISLAKSIAYIDKPLYNYIHYKNSAVRIYRADFFEKRCRFRIKQLEYMAYLHLNDQKYQRISHLMFLDLTVNSINNALSGKESSKHVKEVIKKIFRSELVKSSVNADIFKNAGITIKIFICCYKTKSMVVMLFMFKLLNIVNYKTIFQVFKKIISAKNGF